MTVVKKEPHPKEFLKVVPFGVEGRVGAERSVCGRTFFPVEVRSAASHKAMPGLVLTSGENSFHRKKGSE